MQAHLCLLTWRAARSGVCVRQTFALRQPLSAAQGVFEDDESIHIVMELCQGGALMDRVKQVRPHNMAPLSCAMSQPACQPCMQSRKCCWGTKAGTLSCRAQ